LIWALFLVAVLGAVLFLFFTDKISTKTAAIAGTATVGLSVAGCLIAKLACKGKGDKSKPE
jgi:hypothetical protein